VRHVLATGANEIRIDAALAERARLPIDRMLAFAAKHGIGAARVAPAQALDSTRTGGIGPA
jgi:quinolinate synthase